MNTPGGFGQRIRVPAGWVVPRPAGLTLEQSMILGTAGFTAALAVDKLEASGMRPSGGPVLVTGATGGVGSVAVMLLARLGYEVAAVTGKADAARLSEAARRQGSARPRSAARRRQSADAEGTVGRCGRHRRRRHPVQRSEVAAVRLQPRCVRAGCVAAVRGNGASVHSASRQSCSASTRCSLPLAEKDADLEQAGRSVATGSTRRR